MLDYPHINPVLLQFGPLKVHWYGLMYVFGFAIAWLMGKGRAMKPNSGWTVDEVTDLIFYGAIFIVLGGRVGYVFLYNFNVFISDPLTLFRIWEGGMSFHGALIGGAVGMLYLGSKYKKSFLTIADFTVPLGPIGIGLGRIANFINGELWGKPTDLPWGMVFPHGGPFPRHPSQLYESLLEGVLLFVILWTYSSRPRPKGAVSGLFLVIYGLIRIFIEWFREPDPQIGYLAFNWLTMGQLLSIPMVTIGLVMIGYGHFKQKREPDHHESLP